MGKLLPCPFCGAAADDSQFPFDTRLHRPQIRCSDREGCRVKPYVEADTDEECRALWNTRTPTSADAAAGDARDPRFCGERTDGVFTYERQPGNIGAWKLGDACFEASQKPGGHYIDRGLQLLKELQDKGYGVVVIAQPAERVKS